MPCFPVTIIGGTNDERLASFEVRAKAYKRFGVELKKDDDRVSPDIEGMKFLGYTAHFSKQHGCFVPVFNHKKALVSLLRPDGAQDDLMRYIRMTALRVVCYFTPARGVFRDMCRNFWSAKFHEMQNPFPSLTKEQFKQFAQPLDDRAIEQLWLGYEDRKRKKLQSISFLAMSGRQTQAKTKRGTTIIINDGARS